jgi:hypothetical protein
MLRLLLFVMVFGFGLYAVTRIADVRPAKNQVTVQSPYTLKRILGQVGSSSLNALVIDGQGQERNLVITRDDVVEVKRGLWVLRPGNYQTDI